MTTPTFGDNVCVDDTPLTRDKGFAGERGIVYGVTTPSTSGISFIGTSTQDVALNVHFEHRNEAFWFAPELVRFVDHNEGIEITLDGVDKKWVRRDDGGWDERSIVTKRRPWWKFWG
jgi:hypothetical protein